MDTLGSLASRELPLALAPPATPGTPASCIVSRGRASSWASQRWGPPGSNSHPTESGETSCWLGTGAAPGALRPHPWRGGGRGAQGWKVRQRWGLLEPAGRPSEDSLPSPGAKVHTGWRPREPLWVQVQLGHPCWWTWSRKSHCPEPVSSVPKGRDFVPLSQMMQVNWGEAPKGPAEGLEG